MTFSEKVENEVRPLMAGSSVATPVSDLSMEEVVESWVALDFVAKKIEKRKEALRERLLAEAEKKGTPTEKGGQSIEIAGTVVTRERRDDKLPDPEKLKLFLEDRRIDPTLVFETRTIQELSPSRLEFAIETGKLAKSDVDPLKGVSYALKMYPNTELETMLKSTVETKKKAAPRRRR